MLGLLNGGLELGLSELFDVDLAWVSDIDKGANKILAHRHPDVPNLGDFTTATDVEPVDVLCAGFPCQPVSHAGKRAGTDDERWLFDDITRLVGLLDPRPRLLVFENVLGLLSANRGHAMARVVHGLAQIGYVGRYRVLRAADVGAPHRRERVFLVAVDAKGARLNPRRIRSWAATGDPTARHSSESFGRGADYWRAFAPTIARWEAVTGRPAPEPLDGLTVSPRFVEWMMGLPEGWVTDVPGLTRNEQLKALGNGVVPQQAAVAVGWLLDQITRGAVA